MRAGIRPFFSAQRSNIIPKTNIGGQAMAINTSDKKFAPEQTKPSSHKAFNLQTANDFFAAARYVSLTPIYGKNDPDLLLKNCTTEPTQKIATDIENRLKGLGFKHSDNGMFYNPKTGTSFIVVIDKATKEISVCFGGLGSEGNIKDKSAHLLGARMGIANTSAATKDFLGGVPDAAKEAMQLGVFFREAAKGHGYKPVMVGHSHGGGLAACAADAAGIDGVIFNGRPVGAGVRKALEKFKSEDTTNASSQAENKITAFVTDKDWVAHQDGILRTVAGILKKDKRPASLAHETWSVPKPKGNAINRHNDICGPFVTILVDSLKIQNAQMPLGSHER